MSYRWSCVLLLLSLLGCDPQQDQYRQAMQRLWRGDQATGARMLKALAENGHAPSQFRLGLLYRLGQGVPRQPHQAVYWFDKAARQDDVGGQYWLAEAYRRGEGAPAAPELAFQAFHRLAERGYAPAQHQIALAYAEGRGVARNDAQ
ncbi:MAG: tetratricopeptide repeat protein, partial [Candidatus Competibacteraceae bacterium]